MPSRFFGKIAAGIILSVLAGTAVGVGFLEIATAASLSITLLPLVAALFCGAAAMALVYRDSRRFLPALAAPASTAPEEGRRAASWLVRAPDRIGAAALGAAAASTWLGALLAFLFDGFRAAGPIAIVVAGLVAGMVALIGASASIGRIAAGVPLAASAASDERPGLGLGQRILLFNGGAAVVGLAAFALVPHDDPRVVWVAGVVLSAALIGVAWLSARTTAGAMDRLVTEVQSVAAGDLTRTVAAPAGGEVALLAGALTKMSASLKSILNNIKSVSNEVAAASEDVAVSSSTIAGRIKDQASSVDAIASAVGNSAEALSGIATAADGLGEDARRSNETIFKMTESIRSVAESAKQLQAKGEDTGRAVTAILGAIEDVRKGAETLFTLAARTSQAIREIDGGVQQIGDSLRDSRDLAELVSRDARDGGEAVRALVVAVEDIRRQVDDVAGVIGRLDKRSWEIQNILEVITDIADQTSLLALNAAIIAAQAGERGKGFAVIADEIKSLADRTGGATKEIGTVIREVQKDVASAGQGMNLATGKAGDGVRLSTTAGRALDAIITSASASKDRIAVIAKASEQAQSQSREIVAAIAGVTKVAGELRAAVQAAGVQGGAAEERTKRMLEIAAHVARAMEEQSKASATIVEAVRSTLEGVEGIREATGGQKKDAEGIETNVAQLRKSAQENAGAVSDLERVVQTLIQEAVVLRHEIDRFKTVEVTRRRTTGF